MGYKMREDNIQFGYGHWSSAIDNKTADLQSQR